VAIDWHRKADRALRVLVRCARDWRTTTYDDLGRQIGVHRRQVGRVLGIIRDEIIAPRKPKTPFINALVVRSGGVAGAEMFGPHRSISSDSKLEDEARKERRKVFEFGDRDQVLAERRLKPVE